MVGQDRVNLGEEQEWIGGHEPRRKIGTAYLSVPGVVAVDSRFVGNGAAKGTARPEQFLVLIRTTRSIDRCKLVSTFGRFTLGDWNRLSARPSFGAILACNWGRGGRGGHLFRREGCVTDTGDE